jgi:ureidoglycolate lyase
MRLITFTNRSGSPALGLSDGWLPKEAILDLSHPALAPLLGPAGTSLRAFVLAYTPALADALRAIEGKEDALLDRSTVTGRLANPDTGKIIGAAFNYTDALDEKRQPYPSEPVIFIKSAHTLIRDGDPILLPRTATEITYEAELAVVIGKQALNITAEQAMDHVFGYGLFNDVSVSEFVRADKNFVRGKNQAASGPFGTTIVHKDEVADPHALDISLDLNGETLQRSSTSLMLFRIPELISYMSSKMPLDPGDIIATGTPAGVAASHQPAKWLKHGDQVVVRIPGIGQLANPVAKCTTVTP